MKRRTNLFYGSNEDNKFITFSNYTETLTGNFLSTDTKIYPSKFLCIYLPGLTDYSEDLSDSEKEEIYVKRKVSLIHYLTAYYENKLAALRDYCINNNELPENKILPLNYLLEGLYKIIGFSENNTVNIQSNYIKENKNPFTIPYIGDISEQDYNGTFTDTICLIDISKYSAGSLDIDFNIYSNIGTSCSSFSDPASGDDLYGWSSNGVPTEYKNVYPNYDIMPNSVNQNLNIATYRFDSGISKINIIQGSENSVKFNIIIPLFDLTNINYKTNISNIYENETSVNLVYDSSSNVLYNKNVPLGMWFSGQDSVILKKDLTTGYCPCWSLLIGSQFKPFPYTDRMPDEVTTASKANAYPTFAMVLSRQNKIIDKMTDLTYQFAYVSNRINSIDSQIKSIGTSYTIDGIHKELIKYQTEMNTGFSDFKDKVMSYISSLKWNAVR